MTSHGQPPTTGSRSNRVGGWIGSHKFWSTVIGVLGLLVAVAGIVVAHRDSQLPKPSDGPTFAATSRRIPSSAGPDNSRAPVRYLDGIEAKDRNGGLSHQPISLSGRSYPRGVNFTCSGTDTFFVFPIAGSNRLTGMLGIDDATPQASGKVADVSFHDQSGRELTAPMSVSLGHPLPLNLDVTDVVQLEIRCTGRDITSGAIAYLDRFGLGDARLT